MFRIIFCFVCLIFVFQFSSCSAIQPTVSSDSTRENNQTNLASPTPPKFPGDNEDENFKKQWESRYNATFDELERNRQLWQKSNIVNYDFTCQQVSDGMNGWEAVVIKVRESKNLSIEKTPIDSPAKIDGYEKFETIDKTFDYLRQRLDEGRLVRAKYNKDFGYPEDLRITFHTNATDGGTGAFIKKFEIIK